MTRRAGRWLVALPASWYVQAMTADAQALLDEALKLPQDARAELAGRLLETLDDDAGEQVEELWAVEIARRVKELDEGTVQTVRWADVRREMRARRAR